MGRDPDDSSRACTCTVASQAGTDTTRARIGCGNRAAGGAHVRQMALVAALLEACEFCDQPENHEHVIETLARPEFVGVSAEILRRGIDGDIDAGHGNTRTLPGFLTRPVDGHLRGDLPMMRSRNACVLSYLPPTANAVSYYSRPRPRSRLLY